MKRATSPRGRGLRVTPLAADSLGARSLATLVETKDASIVIDPGVRLGPFRDGHTPHPKEWARRDQLMAGVAAAAKAADVLIITHYHRDHFENRRPTMYKGKRLLMKHPFERINLKQELRAEALLKSLKGRAEVEFADGQVFQLGDTEVTFSKPQRHGPGDNLGWVLQVAVRRGEECFVHTSDIQGPCRPDHVRFMKAMAPTTILCDGPATYLPEQYGEENFRTAMELSAKMVREVGARRIILDHHLLRDGNWSAWVEPLRPVAMQAKVTLDTVAGYLGREPDLLEARRAQLYVEEAHEDRVEEDEGDPGA